MLSGVLPTITLASLPTARTLFSGTETATTDGSFNTIPRPGTNTKVLAVPRSMPNFFTNKVILLNSLYVRAQRCQPAFYTLVATVNVIDIVDYGLAFCNKPRDNK